MMNQNNFVIRVYGVAIHGKRVLVVDEYWFDTYMTKFPGGGMEFGEGTIDCLKRECMEELGQEVEVLQHFYTTDYFQPTVFIPNKQLVSIYYLIRLRDPNGLKTALHKNDFEPKEGNMAFRWLDIDKLTPDDFSFPIDKKVANLMFHNFV
jgi:ADP-ribose pyrophosphatase YjhB (NUDIX family)